MFLEDKIRRFGLDFTGRYYGTYFAVVVNNESYQTQGVLTVKPTDIVGSISKYIDVKYKGIASKNMGVHWIPEKGDIVSIEFRRGNKNNPYWTGSVWAKGEKSEGMGLKDIGFDFPDGSYIKNNHDSSTFTLHHKDGYEITIDSEGIYIGNGKNITLTSQGLKYNDKFLLDGEKTRTQLEAIGDILSMIQKGMATPQSSAAASGTLVPLVEAYKLEIANLYTT